MSTHPHYYTDLVRRRVTADPPLTPTQRRELNLHFLICPQCRYDYARLLQLEAPEEGKTLLHNLESTLTADLVTPFLRGLARTIRTDQPLTGFQRLLWQFIQTDQESLGRFRLLEADEWLRGGMTAKRD